MQVVSRIQPVDRDLIIRLVSGNPQQRSADFAAYARAKLAEANELNRSATGSVPSHTTIVDGSQGASEDQVKPDGGVIVYEFQIIADVLSWIAMVLEESSPVGGGSDRHSGLYKQSHTLFADGTEVKPGAEPPIASEYIFVNTVPYARKIEGGAGKRPSSPQAPDGVYQTVAHLAASKFSREAQISFGFTPIIGGAIGMWAATPSAKRHAAKNRSHAGTGARAEEWLVRQPAIIVTPK